MVKAFNILRKTEMFKVKNIYILLNEALKNGVNVATLVRIGAKLYANKTAVVYDEKSISYSELYQNVIYLANNLYTKHGLQKGQKIAIACSNHSSHIYSIFAAGYLGLDIYFLHPEMAENQLKNITDKHQFNFIIYDPILAERINNIGYKEKSLVSYSNTGISVENYINKIDNKQFKYKKYNTGRIVVLTAGTTGVSKTASRKTDATAFISPFTDLIERLQLIKYNSLYLATPIYHGFGICALFVSFALGKTIYLTNQFNASEACILIEKHKIESITLVPSMLQRMMDNNQGTLKSLLCIISGGAALSPTLVTRTQETLGNVLFNLYGASEAGFCIMATPTDLLYSPHTIGKSVSKVNVKIVNINNEEVRQGEIGNITICCKWSVQKNEWIKTGDVGYVDDKGYYFLMGRSDDMIVSGGENVYPYELEACLASHPSIMDAVVIGVEDKDFGQRLKAFVVVKEVIEEKELKKWLSDRIARYQMPREIIFLEKIPLTNIGKTNKKYLKDQFDK